MTSFDPDTLQLHSLQDKVIVLTGNTPLPLRNIRDLQIARWGQRHRSSDSEPLR